MHNKLLVVYNPCGITPNDHLRLPIYFSALDSILNQSFYENEVVISSCCNSKQVKEAFIDRYRNSVMFNFMDAKLPVTVTFNKSVIEAVKIFGEFEGYVYVASDIIFGDNKYVLDKMYNVFKSGPYAMVSANVDFDSGNQLWGITPTGLYEVPLGSAVNLHCQIFSNDIYKAYGGKVYPDIFAGHCSESVFSFVCAAIKRKWVVISDLIVHHEKQKLDVQSAGFTPRFPQWEHPYLIKSVLEVVKRGYEFGLGYEECQNILLHDPTKFDINGYSLTDDLRNFIKNNLFLSKEYLDYDTIACTGS